MHFLTLLLYLVLPSEESELIEDKIVGSGVISEEKIMNASPPRLRLLILFFRVSFKHYLASLKLFGLLIFELHLKKEYGLLHLSLRLTATPTQSHTLLVLVEEMVLQ